MYRLRVASRLSNVARRRMSTLVYAEHNSQKLNDATRACITAATKLNEPVSVLVCGNNHAAVVEEVSKIAGVNTVISTESESLSHQVAEDVTATILALQGEKSFTNIVAPAGANGKNILPRVAAALDVGMISDVIDIKSADIFVRPIYAGNALATVQATDSIKIITIRPTSFEKAEEAGTCAEVVKFEGKQGGLSEWISDEIARSERPELTAAKVVVAGGRGMGSKENFSIVNELADNLGAAVGASRAAVDAGYASNDMQVGQTGKVVAPDLYIAVGISGAIQHLAGMKDSKTIVSINKDSDAPIFQVSDYGLVGDLFTAVPALNSQVAAKK